MSSPKPPPATPSYASQQIQLAENEQTEASAAAFGQQATLLTSPQRQTNIARRILLGGGG